MRVLWILPILFLSACATPRKFAYNYFEKKTETASPSDRLTYNIYEEKWEYARPGTRPIYNYEEKKWEYPR